MKQGKASLPASPSAFTVHSGVHRKPVPPLSLRQPVPFPASAGEPFDDDNDDSYWRLQGFIPGGLVEALDHDTLRRLIRGYALIPFSGA